MSELAETFENFVKVEKRKEQESEDFWNSLSKEQQLQVFCAVTRRIHKAELVDKGTYRHCLYNVFGFEFNSYAEGMSSGYFDIHNSIYDEDHDANLLRSFCKKYNIEDAEKKIDEWVIL